MIPLSLSLAKKEIYLNMFSLFDYRSSTDETIAMETTDVTFFSTANNTLASIYRNTDNKITTIVSIIVPTSVVFVAICIVVAVIIKRRKVNCLQCKGNSKKVTSNIVLRH